VIVKTILQILYYINSLCSDHSTDHTEEDSAQSTCCIYYVYLLSWHGAKEDKVPIFKGFPFAVFAEVTNFAIAFSLTDKEVFFCKMGYITYSTGERITGVCFPQEGGM